MPSQSFSSLRSLFGMLVFSSVTLGVVESASASAAGSVVAAPIERAATTKG